MYLRMHGFPAAHESLSSNPGVCMQVALVLSFPSLLCSL